MGISQKTQLQNWSALKIAIIYDRVNTRHGGAELVLTALHTAFPQADLITSVADLTEATWAQRFPRVITTWLQKWPGANHLHRWLALFMPLAFESLSLQNYDVILSVSSAEAKGVLTTPHQLHICYLLSPPRYLYHQQTELLEGHWLTRLPLLRQIADLALTYLRWWDQVAIHRPDVLIPLSNRVTQQLQDFYQYPHRKIDKVLYPPIQLLPKLGNTTKLPTGLKNIPAPYFLQVARLVPYKKVALSMEATALAQQNLVVVGEGPDFQKLTHLANYLNQQSASKITLLGTMTTEELNSLYQHCLGVLMPGEEDFGLTALEANAAGKPAIVYALSGAAEVIEAGKHGIHLKTQTQAALAQAMKNLLQQPWSPQLLRQNAAKYDTNRFVAEVTVRLQQFWLEYKQKERYG